MVSGVCGRKGSTSLSIFRANNGLFLAHTYSDSRLTIRLTTCLPAREPRQGQAGSPLTTHWPLQHPNNLTPSEPWAPLTTHHSLLTPHDSRFIHDSRFTPHHSRLQRRRQIPPIQTQCLKHAQQRNDDPAIRKRNSRVHPVEMRCVDKRSQHLPKEQIG